MSSMAFVVVVEIVEGAARERAANTLAAAPAYTASRTPPARALRAE